MQVAVKNLSGKRLVMLCVMAVFALIATMCGRVGAEPVSAGNGPNVIVLNYHKIDFYEDPLSVTPTEFANQLNYFKTYNYHIVSLNELYDYLEKDKPLPTKPVIITFDDGYADNYTYAYPLLKKFGYPATIFVITKLVGTKGYINWEQAREMQANGISIESHTVNHITLSTLPNEQALFELTRSKEIIEAKLGQKINFVAYPEGYYNKLTEKLVQDAGYRGALTIRYGNVDKASDLYALERIPIFHTSATIRDFMRRIHYASNYARAGWLP